MLALFGLAKILGGYAVIATLTVDPARSIVGTIGSSLVRADMAMSSIFVVTNSLRLKKIQPFSPVADKD